LDGHDDNVLMIQEPSSARHIACMHITRPPPGHLCAHSALFTAQVPLLLAQPEHLYDWPLSLPHWSADGDEPQSHAWWVYFCTCQHSLHARDLHVTPVIICLSTSRDSDPPLPTTPPADERYIKCGSRAHLIVDFQCRNCLWHQHSLQVPATSSCGCRL